MPREQMKVIKTEKKESEEKKETGRVKKDSMIPDGESSWSVYDFCQRMGWSIYFQISQLPVGEIKYKKQFEIICVIWYFCLTWQY